MSTLHTEPATAPPDMAPHATPPRATENEVVAYLRGRSAPCPRCGYELRDLERPTCPECGEPLVLKVGSPYTHFAWIVVAMAPGCFSGVAAALLAIPVCIAISQHHIGHHGMPYSVLAAEAFGLLSAASLAVMYRVRHRFMARSRASQIWLAASVWGIHLLAFALFVLGMLYFQW